MESLSQKANSCNALIQMASFLLRLEPDSIVEDVGALEWLWRLYHHIVESYTMETIQEHLIPTITRFVIHLVKYVVKLGALTNCLIISVI